MARGTNEERTARMEEEMDNLVREQQQEQHQEETAQTEDFE